MRQFNYPSQQQKNKRGRPRLALMIALALIFALLFDILAVVVVSLHNNNSLTTFQPLNSGSYLFSKVIAWGDGTIESIGIDSNGFFEINGEKRRLLGFCDTSMYSTGDQFDDVNRKILDTELGYLQKAGIRLYELDLGPCDSLSDYNSVMQILYSHKMLVVPLFSLQGIGSGFTNHLIPTDFKVKSSTASSYFASWINMINYWSNVVTIGIENEMDMSSGYSYTLADATAYMDMLYSYAKTHTTIPVITKFGYVDNSAFAATVQNAFLHYSAIPCFDVYCSTDSKFADAGDAIKAWYSLKTGCSNFWVTETNYGLNGKWAATKFNEDMIDALFAHNASAVFLFCVQDKYIPEAMFFDSRGNHIAYLDTLMEYVSEWQAAIPNTQTVSRSPTTINIAGTLFPAP
jgi:hypothetical protein